MFPSNRNSRWDLQLFGLPAALQDSQFSKLPPKVQPKTLEYWQRFNELPAGIAPIYIGRAQTGKSRAAALLALTFAKASIGVEWVNCPSQMPEIERAKFTEDTRDVVHRWKRIPVLILDDFLHPIVSTRLIQEFLWAREAAQLPTILTGNVNSVPGQELVEIAKAYGAGGPGMVHRLQTVSSGFGMFTS